ncbi:hypothetical protein [Acetonema longum]|uniref:Uncharacterized protein n=1 Tax=Acetonema longum DSM 6540 TaxID=1009370 RepID=F7NE68_9FIRM|nr:hypothetical protein [Acetonema longum]EGO65723.1 hypothetical protein ALO_01654 [Acetonema longum DSM 6540]
MFDPLERLPIVDTILSDVNALATQFNTLTAAYRLLVGSAEEIPRIKGVNPEITMRAVQRIDRAGALLDMLLEILCYKVSFSTDFLAVTSAPVEIFRQLQECCQPVRACDTAKQIVELEALRQLLGRCRNEACFYDKTSFPPYVPPPPMPKPPGAKPPAGQQAIPSDIQEKIITDIVQNLATVLNPETTVLRDPEPTEALQSAPLPPPEPPRPRYKCRPKEPPPPNGLTQRKRLGQPPKK